MTALLYLIPISLLLGTVALFAFLWTAKNGQYEDLDGAAARILTDEDKPLPRSRGLDRERRIDSGQL